MYSEVKEMTCKLVCLTWATGKDEEEWTGDGASLYNVQAWAWAF